MGKHHTVVQGEYLSMLARVYGFASYQTIWDAPENKDLKDLRKNPNVLFPGDDLFIPDKEIKEETRTTEKRHKFEVAGEPLKLRIVLMDLDKKPLAGHECTLVVEADSQNLKTASDGSLETEISLSAAQARLTDKDKPGVQVPLQREITMQIGYLDPVTTISGQIARLNNLGYEAGPVSDHPLSPAQEETLGKSPRFRSAVEEFQCDFMGNNDLATIKQVVDGQCGKKTQDKLLEVHGC